VIDLNLNPTKRELRTFGLCTLGFLCLVGCIIFRRGGSMPTIATVVGIGIALAGLGLTIPQALRPIWVVLTIVNYPIGWVVTHVVMGLIFYLVVTPIGVIMRLTGRDPMERAFDRSAKTYWKLRRTDSNSSRYFRQY
jgi:Saxitoxin biosynthesis operon protein SxtJ